VGAPTTNQQPTTINKAPPKQPLPLQNKKRLVISNPKLPQNTNPNSPASPFLVGVCPTTKPTPTHQQTQKQPNPQTPTTHPPQKNKKQPPHKTTPPQTKTNRLGGVLGVGGVVGGVGGGFFVVGVVFFRAPDCTWRPRHTGVMQLLAVSNSPRPFSASLDMAFGRNTMLWIFVFTALGLTIAIPPPLQLTRRSTSTSLLHDSPFRDLCCGWGRPLESRNFTSHACLGHLVLSSGPPTPPARDLS